MSPEHWLEQFRETVKRPEKKIDLARAAFIVATDEYPDLDISCCQRRLDNLAARASFFDSLRLSPQRRIERLNDFLFGEMQFTGPKSPADPRDSYLNDVIERRHGLPITLSILYMEIARRLGMPIRGVGFPGHFIVKWHLDGEEFFIDPTQEGRTLDDLDLLALVERSFQRQVPLRREWLEAVGARFIITRLLSNLKRIFIQSENLSRAFLVTQKLLVILPFSQDNLRDASMLSYRMGSLRHAAKYMEEYLLHHPDAPEGAPMRVYLRTVWIALTRLS